MAIIMTTISNFRSTSFIRLVFTVAIGTFSSYSVAASTMDDEAESKISFPTDQATLELKIVDNKGEPISNAKVAVYAMRCKEDIGSHYGWPAENMKMQGPKRSNDAGLVMIDYPVRFGRPNDWKTTVQLSLTIEHADFVSRGEHYNLSEPHPIELERGCKVTLMAQNIQGNPIEHYAPLLMYDAGLAVWRKDGKKLTTGGLQVGKHLTLIAGFENDQWLFSDALTLTSRLEVPITLDNIVLKPGAKLRGTLNEQVPRPVKAGSISAIVYPKIKVDDPFENNQIYWEEIVPIREDGSFEFPSLPRCGEVQLIARCNGWIVKTDEGKGRGSFISGHQLSLNGEKTDIELELDMEPTGTLKFDILNPYGESAAGIQIATWPNMFSLTNWSSGLLRDVSSSTGMLSRFDRLDGKEVEKDRGWKFTINDYMQVSDENGSVTLTNIPLNRDYDVMILHDEYQLPMNPKTKRREFSYRLTSEEPLEAVLLLEKAD